VSIYILKYTGRDFVGRIPSNTEKLQQKIIINKRPINDYIKGFIIVANLKKVK
jgi:hypothetical protein